MLKKLLKYDLRAIFRYWWIVALVSVGMAVLGGFAQSILANTEVPEVITMVAGIIVFFTYFCMVGLVLLTQILLFIRFYRNFFTDEGYLTFTLPVKRETLFNSKVLAGMIGIAASIGVCMLNAAIMIRIVFHQQILSGEFAQEISEFFMEMPPDVAQYLLLYSLEALIILALLMTLSVLFLYCCITFGSMIVKKGKLFASIGIYYGASCIATTATQILLIFGTGSIGVWLEPLSEQLIPNLVALLLLIAILLLAMLCSLIYAFTHWMLGRKLNLS